MFEQADTEKLSIKVVGSGRLGINATEYMAKQPIECVTFVTLDAESVTWKRPLPTLQGVDALFIVTDIENEADTAIAATLAQTAKDLGILTVMVVIDPLNDSADKVSERTLCNKWQLTKQADCYFFMPYNKNNTSIFNQIHLTIKAMVEPLTREGLIGIDFSDLVMLMTNSGEAIMVSHRCTGEHRAENAVLDALLDTRFNDASLYCAQCIWVNISANESICLKEIEQVGNAIKAFGNKAQCVAIAAVIAPEMGDALSVSIVASGSRALKEHDDRFWCHNAFSSIPNDRGFIFEPSNHFQQTVKDADQSDAILLLEQYAADCLSDNNEQEGSSQNDTIATFTNLPVNDKLFMALAKFMVEKPNHSLIIDIATKPLIDLPAGYSSMYGWLPNEAFCFCLKYYGIDIFMKEICSDKLISNINGKLAIAATRHLLPSDLAKKILLKRLINAELKDIDDTGEVSTEFLDVPEFMRIQ
jgi:cell division GTPase FtsZ